MFAASWNQLITSKSNVFFYCLVAFAAGIFSGSFLILPHFYLFCPLLLLIFFMMILVINQKHQNHYFCISLFLISFVFGLWRYNLALPDFGDTGKIHHYASSTVEFVGRVKSVDSRLAGQKITVATELLTTQSAYRPISGPVLINQPLYPEYYVGEKVAVRCLLERPGMIEDFDWGKYLSKEGIFTTCAFAEVSSISPPAPLSFRSLLFRFKKYLTQSLNASVSEPEVSLLRGILLGDGRGLPDEYNRMFSDLGLTHIIAISGDHIAIVAAALLSLLIAIGVSRPKAFWPLAAIIAFYVALVGAPASAVRAAIMALSVMYAQKIGRSSRIRNVLASAAAIMILFNPMILLGDVGFQLSFMAVWGLSYISPLWATLVQKAPNFFRIKEILTATLSAQIATLPLLLFYFGKLSLISVAANILILPVIPYLTVWGLLNLIASAIFLPLGRIMGYASWLLSAYWIYVSELLHQIPFGYFVLGDFGLVGLTISYCLIFFGLYFINWRRKSRANGVLTK